MKQFPVDIFPMKPEEIQKKKKSKFQIESNRDER
jgi:hypothetical protein